MRESKVIRKTKETDTEVSLNIDGAGKGSIDTGIGFLDHMLTLFCFHGNFDMNVKCRGDLYVDTHHTAEDIGIALGTAFYKAMKDKLGINRYGLSLLPMDEALARCAVDISGRAYLVYNVSLKKERIGAMDTEDFKEFFRAFCVNFGITLHIELLYGDNDHHKIEAVFKGFGRALKQAAMIVSDGIVSTKGVI